MLLVLVGTLLCCARLFCANMLVRDEPAHCSLTVQEKCQVQRMGRHWGKAQNPQGAMMLPHARPGWREA